MVSKVVSEGAEADTDSRGEIMVAEAATEVVVEDADKDEVGAEVVVRDMGQTYNNAKHEQVKRMTLRDSDRSIDWETIQKLAGLGGGEEC